MTDATGPTFRDFASAIFAGDLAGASATLETLLALPPDRARVAAEHFRARTSEPAFLPKAMSLRTAVEGADDEAIATLLIDCFALATEEARAATAVLRVRFRQTLTPSPSPRAGEGS